MPSDRTLVTEIGTGLGTLGKPDVAAAVDTRPHELVNLTQADWDRLTSLWQSGLYHVDFGLAFSNGAFFLASPDALNGRRPRIVEWTGGRRPLGDEVAPIDLRIDHVYLISSKYLSRILHNPSPARLFEGLLTQSPLVSLQDWYQRVAPKEHQALYEACLEGIGPVPMPHGVSDLTKEQRLRLKRNLADGWSPGADELYTELCEVVAVATAKLWRARVTRSDEEVLLWRLLRIGSAPYFILGAGRYGPVRLRIDSPWDWRQRYRLRRLDIEAQPAGQPRVRWSAAYIVRLTGAERTVHGHVEIRWSHGRFAQPPEAKVYLDSPHSEVPGYHPI